jgi:hypothetical protein
MRSGAGKKWVYSIAILAFGVVTLPVTAPMFYLTTDYLRGHPQGRHGAQPEHLVGLWSRDVTVESDFLGQAFYLMPDGRLVGTPGLTFRRWHFDNNKLYVDSVSMCGNCFQGNVTTERLVSFESVDRINISDPNGEVRSGIVGKYSRVVISPQFKAELRKREESESEKESFKARRMLMVIEHFERLTKS